MLIRTLTQIGKHKIPRFIYHMTSKGNYESMLKDGMIKTSEEAFIGKGVFATELTNFFKHWRTDKSWNGESLQGRLLDLVTHKQKEIVMLKIPTEKLSADKLVIRSQNRLFGWGYSKNGEDILEKIKEFEQNNKNLQNNLGTEIRRLIKELMSKGESENLVEHITEGTSAKMSKLYKQRKEALEYIYLDNIQMSNVEKIGEVNIGELKQSSKYDPAYPLRSVFTSLLAGTPEVKGAELLNC